MASAATDGVKWEWLVKNDTYLLTLNIPADLKLEELRVRVDGKRRLTITDRRKPTPGEAPRLNKRFQLPKKANPDTMTACFDGGVLRLTVPMGKKGQQQPPAPAVTVAATKKEEEPEAKAEREKELIDTAVAAFTLGVLFSHRLFSSRNQ